MADSGGRRGRGQWVRAVTGRTRPVGWFVVGVTAALLAVWLWPGPSTHRDTAEPSGQLVLLSGRDESPGGQRQQLIDAWNASHPDTPARVEELPSDAGLQHSEMVARAQARDGTVDIYNLDVTSVAEFAAAGYLRPLDDVPTTGFLSRPLQTGRYTGRQWALPFNTDAGLLFYRKDLVTAAELRRQLPPDAGYTEQLHRQDAHLVAAYAGQLADYEGLTVNALEAIWAAGGDVVNDQGEVLIDSPQAVAGLRRLAEAVRAPSGGIPAVVHGYDEDGGRKAFSDGKVALMRNWPVHYGRIKAAGGQVADNFDVARLPGQTVLGGQDLAISADSAHPSTARQLIEFLTSPDSQVTLFAKGGFAAVRDSTYVDPAVLRTRPYATALLAAVRAARPRPVTPHYALLSKAIRDVVEYALAHDGRLRPDAAPTLSKALKGQG
jgi:multiple sugar transport system substrate-binding protein